MQKSTIEWTEGTWNPVTGCATMGRRARILSAEDVGDVSNRGLGLEVSP